MRKVLAVFGTRPDAIKMCPVIKELKKQTDFSTVVCATGQHREMLKQVLDCFQIEPEYNLDIMKPEQTLFDITEKVISGMRRIYETEKPDIVLVHGDTSTAFASALAAFYMKIPVGHVEAGLRTYHIQSPYPEEFNRQAIGNMAALHFAPTQKARENLLREGKQENDIFVTGNTSIDALKYTIRKDYDHEQLRWLEGSRFVLLTAHRRENLGSPLYSMFKGIKRVLDEHPEVKILYPVHKNPKVKEAARAVLGETERIRMTEPLQVLDFHNFLYRADLVLTDSGGIQEEALALGKPVLVLRDTSERPEGVEAGAMKVVGCQEETVYETFRHLLENEEEYRRMSCGGNVYGDGTASRRIVEILLEREGK